MKRDPRLRSLSSDHHRALVMARKMDRVAGMKVIDPVMLREIKTFCRDELQPHFAHEEQALLPALMQHGETLLVDRTLREHARMTELARTLDRREALQELAHLLREHVRFEEQQLFDVAQTKLSEVELESIQSHASATG